MEQNPEDSAEQGKAAAAVKTPSLGAMLRDARNQLGLSVAEVAAQIKFAPRQIEALEADDFKNLPEAAFLRGFVRSYAKILNLDAQTLLASLPQAKAQAPELVPASVGVPFPVDYSAQKNLIMLGAALLLAVIVAGFAVWHFTTPLKHAQVVKVETPVTLPAEMQSVTPPAVQQQESTVATTVPEPKRRSTMEKTPPRKEKNAIDEGIASAQSAVSGKHKRAANKSTAASGIAPTIFVPKDASARTASLRLQFDEESWTEITDGNGKSISSQINPPGSELEIEGQLPLSLVIGHASATHLYEDGNPIDLVPHTSSSNDVARITLK
ncbi:MAG: RodZ domain-containing protein [Gallionella sp.]